MKLECPVVRDMYTLYVENELSTEVRVVVEQHLENCEDCRHVYECESDFNDILKKDTDEQPSKKLDEKMMLKLKVSRLRIAVIFIAAIFIITLYSNYSLSRYNLLYDISQAEDTLYKISFKIDEIKNDNAPIASFSDNMESLNNQQNNATRRELNLVEKSQLKKVPSGLFMNFQVERLYALLKTRHMKGTFTERDEKAYSLLKKYMEDIPKALGDERQNLNKLHEGGKLQALIRPIDIKNIAEKYDKLNELAVVYTQYDKFPEELNTMSEADLKARLKSIFNMDNPDIQIGSNMKESIRLNGDCSFDIKQGSNDYSGDIDAYIGIINIRMSGAPGSKGELLPLDEIKANMLEFLQRIYGKEQSFDVHDMGINYHFSSNTDVKLYSFKVYPLINGLKVYSELWIYYNARTGELFSMSKKSGQDFIVPDYNVDTTTKISPEDGLKNLNVGDKEKYSYSETLIIRSILSGKYVPVHVYKNDNREVFVNTITGNQEFAYY